MEDELISFDTAKLAKEKGFNVPCWDFFKIRGLSEGVLKDCNITRQNFNKLETNIFSRPTQSLLQRWLRKVHEIEIIFKPLRVDVGNQYIVLVGTYKLTNTNLGRVFTPINNGLFAHTYEEALEKGLYKALNLIKI